MLTSRTVTPKKFIRSMALLCVRSVVPNPGIVTPIIPFRESPNLSNVCTHTNKANVLIYNARFVENMPLISFTLKDIPVTLTSNGYILQIDEIIPVLSTSDTPATQYPISNFKLQMSGPDMSLHFNCVPNGTSNYSVTSTGSVYPPVSNQ